MSSFHYIKRKIVNHKQTFLLVIDKPKKKIEDKNQYFARKSPDNDILCFAVVQTSLST